MRETPRSQPLDGLRPHAASSRPPVHPRRAAASPSLALLLAGLLALPFPPAALAADEPTETGIVETVRVELVQFNLLASTKDGKAVLDLKPEDIELTVNGKPQKVAFIDSYGVFTPEGIAAPASSPSALASPLSDAAAPVAAPGATATAQATGQAPAAGSKPGRWVVLMFDTYGTSLRTRNLSIAAAREYVDNDLDPSDRISVVNFTGKLQVIQAFTRDAGLVREAIDKVSLDMERATPDRVGQLEQLVEEMSRCEGVAAAGICAGKNIAAWRDENLRTIDAYLKALTSLVRSLSAIPDIKVIHFFTDGLPRDPASEAYDAATIALGRESTAVVGSPQFGLEERLWDRLSEAAAIARVSFFTIVPGSVIGRFASTSARQRTFNNERTNPFQIDIYRRSEGNLVYGSADIAQRTGGTIIRNADPLAGLRQAMQASSGLYTVGFYPRGLETVRGNGYKIKVKALRKGLEVSTTKEVPRSAIRQKLGGGLQVSTTACSADGNRQLTLAASVERQRLAFEKIDRSTLSANYSIFFTIVLEGEAFPAYADFRFFNVSGTPGVINAKDQPDPVVEQRFVVPCRPLRATAMLTDAGSGAQVVLTEDVGL